METWTKNEMFWGTIDIGDVCLGISAFNALTGDDLSIDEIEALRAAIIRDHELAALAEEVKRRVEAGLETPVRTVSDQRVVIAEMWDWLVDEYRARYDAIATSSAEEQS